MRKMFVSLAVLGLLLCQAPAGARADNADDALELFAAYQVGYLQVVAHSCFQLYSSTGIIATDFAEGHINADTALYALEHNLLMHSVCVTTLIEIKSLTPEADAVAHAEFDRLGSILDAEGQLLSDLEDVILHPNDENTARVESSRAALELLLDEYTTISTGD